MRKIILNGSLILSWNDLPKFCIMKKLVLNGSKWFIIWYGVNNIIILSLVQNIRENLLFKFIENPMYLSRILDHMHYILNESKK
jgi:hypothetical protein